MPADDQPRVQCGGWTLAGIRCKHTKKGESEDVWYCSYLHRRQAASGIYRLQCENRPHCYNIAEFTSLKKFLAAIEERNEHYGCCSSCSPRTQDPSPPADFMAELQELVRPGKYDTMMSSIREHFGVQ